MTHGHSVILIQVEQNAYMQPLGGYKSQNLGTGGIASMRGTGRARTFLEAI